MSDKSVEILEDIAEMLEEKLTAMDWKLWEIYKIAKVLSGDQPPVDGDDTDDTDDKETDSVSKRAPLDVGDSEKISNNSTI